MYDGIMELDVNLTLLKINLSINVNLLDNSIFHDTVIESIISSLYTYSNKSIYNDKIHKLNKKKTWSKHKYRKKATTVKIV